MDTVAKLTQQLNTVKKLAGIVFGPRDGSLDQVLTARLAGYLQSIGTADIRDITDTYYSAALQGIDAKAAGLPDIVINLRTGATVDFYAAHWDTPDRIRWVPAPQFTKDGFPIYMWSGSHIDTGGFVSSFLEMAAPIAPIALLVLSVALPGAGSALGSAILGPSLSASAPFLVPVVGNAAIGTALNGGDVGAAVKGAVKGAVTGNLQAGAFDAIGSVASSATQAFITNGDAALAAQDALAATGATDMGDFFSLDTVDMTSIDTSQVQPTFSDAGYAAASGTDYSGGVDVTPGTFSIPAETPTTASGELVFDDSMGTVTSTPSTPSSTASDALSVLSNLAVGALKVYQTWQRNGKQTIATPGVVQNANGSVTAPRKDGMLVTTSATGRVTTGRMPVGKPYLFADGSIVTNNGDGTYTTISATGTATTTPYPPSSGLSSLFGGGGSDNGKLVLAGLAVVGLVLIARR